jgi:hypothetical protein
MQNPKFPQSISSLDRELGFQLLPIAGLGGDLLHPNKGEQVVIKILSSCEILLKAYDLDGNICYNHKKYGYDVLFGQETPYQWYPVSGGWKDPKEILGLYEKGIKTLWEKQAGQIHGCPFPFPKA